MPIYRSVNVTKLSPGDMLVEPVFNERRTKLLGSGCAMNERLIRRLAEFGITDVVVETAEVRSEKHLRKASVPKFSVNQDSGRNVPRLVEHCCDCGAVIAIHPPIADLPVAIWLCQTCGSAYFTGCPEQAKFRGVAPLVADGGGLLTRGCKDQEGQEGMSLPAVDADTTAGCSGKGPSLLKDRRRQTRHQVTMPVVAVPLRLDFTIAGQAVRMTTRNISQAGAALAYARFSDVPYYALDFTAAGMELLQIVLEVQRVTNSGPVYEVAGKFISRVAQKRGDSPSAADSGV